LRIVEHFDGLANYRAEPSRLRKKAFRTLLSLSVISPRGET